MFSTRKKNFLLFSSNLKLSSAKFFSLEKSKIWFFLESVKKKRRVQKKKKGSHAIPVWVQETINACQKGVKIENSRIGAGIRIPSPGPLSFFGCQIFNDVKMNCRYINAGTM